MASGPFVPGDLERLHAVRRRPVAVGHHRDAAGDLHDVLHARHRLGLVGIEAGHLAAEDGAAHDARHQQAGQLDVRAELGAAVHLARDVEPRHVRAEQRERFRILERRRSSAPAAPPPCPRATRRWRGGRSPGGSPRPCRWCTLLSATPQSLAAADDEHHAGGRRRLRAAASTCRACCCCRRSSARRRSRGCRSARRRRTHSVVTLFQSTSSSSARSIGIAVITPWPISSIESMMRALPSAVIFTHTLGSKTPRGARGRRRGRARSRRASARRRRQRWS